MNRRLAHRPRYQRARIYPQPSHRTYQKYLHQRWTYRQQRDLYPKRSSGYGLANLPWGWRLVRDVSQLWA